MPLERLLCLPCAWPLLAAAGLLMSSQSGAAQETPVDRAQIVHVLNRITFGPRPGDVDMVAKLGLRTYIEQQLHPELIDDSAVEQQLSGFDLLQMPPPQLTEMYRENQKNNLKKAAEQNAATPPPATAMPGTMTMTPGEAAPAMEEAPVPPSQTAALNSAAGSASAAPPTPANAAVLGELNKKAGKHIRLSAIGELQQAKLVRAVNSQRQLQEVLVDFWGNHFNIDVHKGIDSVLKVADDRDVIRPHIWSHFRELLEASAKSPAMLYYLDNASNTVGHTVTAREQMFTERVRDQMMANGNGAVAPPVVQAGKKRGGPNENYGREIMELHTLGVDGGYTQQDVQEVARCFTGWTVDRKNGEFVFRPQLHDNGAKMVLGHAIPAGGGMQDGETVLDILASSPATAHHISYELCQRFVSDTPAEPLVRRIAAVYTQTDGDLRKVTEAILTSPEFLSPSDYNNKIKSPLEFAVSAVRASAATIVPQAAPPFNKIIPAMEGAATLGLTKVNDRMAKLPRQSLNIQIGNMGEPLFACNPPTGYKEISQVWVNPGALIGRLNFSMALTEERIRDIRFNPQSILAGTDLDQPQAVLNQCVSVLLHNDISPATRHVLEQTVLPTAGDSKTVNPTKLIALIIGSPEFQRK